MSLLSSYTLFHFTSTLGRLMSILEGGLRYSWVAEKLPTPGLAYLVRSACFCNIPLSMIGEHVEWYGKYAIGLKRRALRDRGASPVFYMHSDTALIYKRKDAMGKYADENFLPYFKTYYGAQKPSGSEKYKMKKFYDEKEWRLFVKPSEVVRYANLDNLEEIRKKKADADQAGPTAGNEEPPKLKISADMIEYIILEDPADLDPFKVFLKNAFTAQYEDMVSKVLFYKQIRRDF